MAKKIPCPHCGRTSYKDAGKHISECVERLYSAEVVARARRTEVHRALLRGKITPKQYVRALQRKS